jgi:predicted ATPase
LAQELSHPFSLAFALNGATRLYLFRREWQAAQEQAEAAITLSTEQGFAYWLAAATFRRGGALAEQGQEEEGIAQMRQGLAALRATGAELWRPNYLSMLAEAYGKMGQAEEGLTVLVEALVAVNSSGERMWEAEIYRLKGELLLKQKAKGKRQKAKMDAEAEACFRQSIDIARRQGAKSLELRAVMSLSRLWQGQGKKKEARKMLAEIYGWFTEGFDTADLKEARALLEELL